jgi:hypothetical protein
MAMMDWEKLGWLLMVLAVIGLSLALGNVISLPSIQRQLVEAVPNAEPAVAEAIASSRSKSYYGIGICLVVFLCGAGLTRIKRSEPDAHRT